MPNRMKPKAGAWGAVCLILGAVAIAPDAASAASAASAADTADAAGGPLAEVVVSAERVDWLPAADVIGRLALTVSGPGGAVERREFAPGEAPVFAAHDDRGRRRPDGGYTWELRALAPPPAAGTLDQVRDRDAGGHALPAGRRVQWGYLTLRDRAFVTPGLDEAAGGAGAAATGAALGPPVVAPDQVLDDELIVAGRACVGFHCAAGEPLADETLLLKEEVVRLGITDTSAVAGFPSGDWRLIFNDAASGGADRFSLDDLTAGTTPWTVEGGAPSNALYTDDSGRLGLGTSTPAAGLHLVRPMAPAIRLEQDGTGGPPARSWDLVGSDTGFSLVDVTGAGAVPLRVAAGAPGGAVELSATGALGIGAAVPTAPVHVRRADGTARFLIEETAAPAVDRTLFELRNNGGVRFFFTNTDNLESWQMTAFPGTLQFSLVGTDKTKFRLLTDGSMRLFRGNTQLLSTDATGNLTIAGMLFTGSSRTLKERLAAAAPRELLMRLVELPLFEWSYRGKADRHLGPMAEDFHAAFGLGGDPSGLAVLDLGGVAAAAVQGLHELVAERTAATESEIAALRARHQELEARLAVLEAALAGLVGEQEAEADR